MSQSLKADCAADLALCKEDAGAVIRAADQTIKNDAALISLQSDQIQGLRFNYSAIKSQLDEQKVWYRQPNFVVPVTVLATIFAIKRF